MSTITQRVVRNARKRGVDVVGRNSWVGDSGIDLGIYARRRTTHPHGLLPGKPVDTLWCHITVTPRENIRADMRLLHRIGMERFGTGCSYNFGIDHITGEVGVGQALDAKGAHTLNDKDIEGYSFNQNLVSLAFAWIGMPGSAPTERAIVSAAKLVAALIDEKALTRGHDFNPHSMVAFKECPTDNMRAVMPRINKFALLELAGKLS